MPIPLGRAFAALGKSMPGLMAIAGISATVLIAGFVGVIAAENAHLATPEGMFWALATLFAALHAVFLVAASRVIADSADDRLVVQPLSCFGWARAVLTVLVLVAAVAAAFATAIKYMTPYPPTYASFLGTVAVTAWTPFLPILALGQRGIVAAVTDSAPDLARFIWCGVWTSLPFLLFVGLLAVPVLGSDAMSFGLFDGGIIAFPLLGLCLFVAATTMALVPTTVYAALKPSMELSQ